MPFVVNHTILKQSTRQREKGKDKKRIVRTKKIIRENKWRKREKVRLLETAEAALSVYNVAITLHWSATIM